MLHLYHTVASKQKKEQANLTIENLTNTTWVSKKLKFICVHYLCERMI